MSGINVKLSTGGLLTTTKDTSSFVHLSIQYRGTDTLPSGIVAKTKVYKMTSVDDLYTLSATYKTPTAYSDMLTAYHIKQFFDFNGQGLLFVTFYEVASTDSDIAEGFDTALDSTKGGNRNIQLFGVNTKSEATTTVLGVYNTKLKNMQILNNSGYAVVSGYLASASNLPDFSTLDYRYIGADVTQDLTPNSTGKAIYDKGWTFESTNSDSAKVTTTVNQCGGIGAIMGRISSVPVHINIGWTQLGTLTGTGGWAVGGFSNGTEAKVSNTLNDETALKGLIFVRYYPNYTGLYFAGFRSACIDTDDYRVGNRMRTANKIIAIAQGVLFNYINSPIYSDASTGLLGDANSTPIKNDVESVLVASMIQGKSGNDIEVSGIKVIVDPNQNVLSTSTLNCVVQFIPVGTAETINLTVSATNKI